MKNLDGKNLDIEFLAVKNYEKVLKNLINRRNKINVQIDFFQSRLKDQLDYIDLKKKNNIKK